MDITAPLVLRNDVIVIPVTDLDEQVRKSIDCEDGDFALSRPQSRSTSTVIDPAAAALVEQFRQPRTIVEAVVLFSRARGLEESEVLDDAYRLVRRLVEQDFIRAPGDTGAPDAPAGETHRGRGERVDGLEILRPMHLVEDTEIYLARDPVGGPCVLKMERPGRPGTAILFDREAAVLRHLAGRVGPRLIRAGLHDDRPFLVLEYCRGLESEMAAAEHRQHGEAQFRRQLTMIRRIARAYADLHACGVAHGDVHPRNVLVHDDGVRLIDFGMARLLPMDAAAAPNAGALPWHGLTRGGVAFFFEPEAAEAARAERPSPPPTAAGEQYAAAALLYYLLAGSHYLDFSLGRLELMRQIAEDSPVPLVARGLAEWPSLEAVLFRALSKNPADRFASTAAFAAALDTVDLPPAARSAAPAPANGWPAGRAALDRSAEEVLQQTALDQAWYEQGFAEGPTASLNYGAAGVALVLNRLARRREDPELLARAEAWTCRAAALARADAKAFVNKGGEVSPATVGEASPLHTASGVDLIKALVAHAAGDANRQAAAIAGYLEAASRKAAGLDLTLGQASTLLGAAHLLNIVPRDAGALRRAVVEFGAERLADLWRAIDEQPAIGDSEITNLGLAHGWGGLLYATLLWSAVSGARLPERTEARARELAALAEPSGRALVWPWELTKGGDVSYMSGWCNGTAGYVHLWTLAHRVLGDDVYLDRARGAAWDVWDAPDAAGTLCCGLAGRAYALLAMHRHTADDDWLARARVLGERAAEHGQFEPDYPHSLYKGQLVLAALAADLDVPAQAAQPYFELDAW